MKILLFFLLPFLLSAYEEISPQEVQAQLNAAEAQLKRAQEMFDPWYAGPLLTGSARMMPPGYISIQPYLFVTDNYARFNKHRHSKSIPTWIQLNPFCGVQAGLTSWLDLLISMQGFVNWQSGVQSGGLGDTNVTFGFPLLVEQVSVPALKLGLGETFPTGRYHKLDVNNGGLDATGAGSYQTLISLRIGKLVLLTTQHPLSLRATFTYSIPSMVDVQGPNAYGGGTGTKGRVHPPRQFNASIGMEVSLTQKWVFANDFVYVYNTKSGFSGTAGTNADGTTASVKLPSNDQLSLAPALEYNPTPFLNFIGGIWFSITGRNSSNFISGVFSMAYTFKVK